MSEEQQQQSEPIQATTSAGSPVAMLRSAIRQLEGIAAQLDGESAENLASMTSFQTLIATAQELELEVEKVGKEKSSPEESTQIQTDTAIAVEKEDIEARKLEKQEIDSEEATSSETDTVSAKTSKKKSGGFIRSLLPGNWRSGLVVTGIVAGIAAIVVFTSGLPFPNNPAEEAPRETPPVAIEQPPAKQPETPPAIPQVKAPPKPQPINIPPERKLQLTPEQNLIAAIQQQVAEITNEYAEGLIMSIEANFLGSRLIIKVSDRWYELTDSDRDKVANEMLGRAQKLDFKKLEIIDPEEKLLARSPVVGKNMIILQAVR